MVRKTIALAGSETDMFSAGLKDGFVPHRAELVIPIVSSLHIAGPQYYLVNLHHVGRVGSLDSRMILIYLYLTSCV